MAAKKALPEGVNAGDTFLLPPPYNHLHVVCSDPLIDSERVLLVSITTFAPKEEDCCKISKGEHPFIKHTSCIRYKDARIVSVLALLHILTTTATVKREPVSPELLARIRAGAALSEFLPEECRRLLQDQSLL